jgi:hypothetical protein
MFLGGWSYPEGAGEVAALGAEGAVCASMGKEADANSAQARTNLKALLEDMPGILYQFWRRTALRRAGTTGGCRPHSVEIWFSAHCGG